MEAPAGMGGTDPMGGGTGIIEDPARPGMMTDPAGTATTDPAGTIHFDHEPVQTGEPTNTGIVPPNLQTPTPDSPGGLADVFGEDQPWMDAASPDLGLSTDMTAATDPAAPQPMDAMASDAASPAPAAPMFEDDLLGTNAMTQATAEAPPMPAFEAPAPEVTMTAPDLTPSFAPEEAAPMAPAHEVMAAPEPPPEEHHDFAPVDDSPHPDDSNQD
jgi:hypothetical protein